MHDTKVAVNFNLIDKNLCNSKEDKELRKGMRKSINNLNDYSDKDK